MALLSNILGFVSWSFWLAAVLLIPLMFLLLRIAVCRGHAFFVAMLGGLTISAFMPNLNHTFLMAFGAQRPAVIEKITAYTEFNLGRGAKRTRNERIELLARGGDGAKWIAHIDRKSGIAAPYALPGLLLARDDDVVVAVVEGAPGNVVIISDISPARWQAGLRQLDAGWEIAPPTDNWISHQISRKMIEDFLFEFRDVIGVEAVARLESRLSDLTLLPPGDISPGIIERISP